MVVTVNQSVKPVDNITEMLNAMDSKFGEHVHGISLSGLWTLTLDNFFENGTCPGSRDH